MSLEDGHLGQATPHDILYVQCKLLHLNLLNVICREINFDSDFDFELHGSISKSVLGCVIILRVFNALLNTIGFHLMT